MVQAGERHQLVEALRALGALALQRVGRVGHGGLRLRQIGGRDKPGAELALGQLQGLPARGQRGLADGDQRLAFALLQIRVRDLGRQRHAGIVPIGEAGFEARIGALQAAPLAAEQIELPRCIGRRGQCGEGTEPQRRADAGGRDARAARPAKKLAAAEPALPHGRAAALQLREQRCPAARHRCARLAHAAHGLGQRRAVGAGLLDQLRERRVVELLPPAGQHHAAAVVGQRGMPAGGRFHAGQLGRAVIRTDRAGRQRERQQDRRRTAHKTGRPRRAGGSTWVHGRILAEAPRGAAGIMPSRAAAERARERRSGRFHRPR